METEWSEVVKMMNRCEHWDTMTQEETGTGLRWVQYGIDHNSMMFRAVYDDDMNENDDRYGQDDYLTEHTERVEYLDHYFGGSVIGRVWRE